MNTGSLTVRAMWSGTLSRIKCTPSALGSLAERSWPDCSKENFTEVTWPTKGRTIFVQHWAFTPTAWVD